MRKVFVYCAAALLCFCNIKNVHSQVSDFGYFNSLAIGVNVGTTGYGFDVATPIGNYLQLRLGMNMMPDISYNDDLDVKIQSSSSISYPNVTCNIDGSLKRTTADLILNVYPFRKSSFFVAGGLSFGGKELVKVNGYSKEVAELLANNNINAGIDIGDYNIPFDKNGNVSGGLKVAQTRTYLGLGFGRAVPKKRIGFMFELGAQFHGTPSIYTTNGSLEELTKEADNKYTDIINDIKVYPVLKLRLCGRII